MKKIIDLILYAGLGRDQFKKLAPDMIRRNTKNLYIYSLILSIYFFGSTVVNYIFQEYFRTLYWVYIITAVVMLIIHGVACIFYKSSKNSKGLQILLNYIFMLGVYGEGIALSCFYPDMMGASTTFYVELVLLPVICMDKPLRLIIFQSFASICFIIAGALFKSSEVFSFEFKNFWFFFVISIIIIVSVSSVRIRELMHGLKVEYLSNHDVLTGVKNRNSFERYLTRIETSPVPHFCFIYADVNELHELNNTEGHKAGDIMLQTVADGLKALFTEDNTYRIGGDEFVVYIETMDKSSLEKEVQELGLQLADKGYHVSFGIAGSEENHSTLDELLTIAEKRMYEAKKQYYQSKGISFGKRARDFV